MIRLLLVDANSRASPWFRQRFKLLTKRRPAADPASTPPQKKECRTLRSHHRPVGAKLQPWLQLSPGRVKTPSSSPKSQPVEKTEIQGPLWLKRGIHNVPLRPSPQNGGQALSGVSKSRFRLSLGNRNKVLRLGSAQCQGKSKSSVRLAQDDGFGKRDMRRGLKLSGPPELSHNRRGIYPEIKRRPL